MTEIEIAYADANPRSRALAERAMSFSPGGVSQGFRQLTPFPIYFEEGQGSRKTTVDGNELIDFCMGHGTLIFGHRHPAILEAAQAQLAKGSHFAAPSAPETDMAELVVGMVPSADLVRFTGTGSESCALGLRMARAATGKKHFVKFEGHYHGWHDEFLYGLKPPYKQANTAGIPVPGEYCELVPPGDTAALVRALDANSDVACIMVEPAGGGHGCIPSTDAWLHDLRRISTERGIVLIFDEMVSGFRASPGGYQQVCGIMPDLTLLGKAIFGGTPGAAIAGKRELMQMLSVGADKFTGHNGSWNAYPGACATGIQTLKMLQDGSVHEHINGLGDLLRKTLNDVIAAKGARMHVYGRFSHCHFHFDAWPFEGDAVPMGRHGELHRDANTFRLFRLAMFNAGIDFAFGNNISAAHSAADIEETAARFARGVQMLLDDKVVATN